MNYNKILNSSLLKTVFMVFVIFALLVAVNEPATAAKKKRSKAKKTKVVYSKSKTKAEAIEILKSSEAVAEIAGLEANVDSKTSNAYSSDVKLLKSYVETENSVDNVGEYGEDIAELEAEDDVVVDLDNFQAIWLLAFGESERTETGIEKSTLMSTIMHWLGTPYRFGGMERSGIDCSAWVQAVFYQTDSISLPRTAREQVNIGRKIKREKLEFGDLVFFHTYSKKFASHVGIYLGDNLFAHASSRKGVTVSSLNSTFYDTRFIGGKRLSSNDLSHLKITMSRKLNNY